MKLRDILNLISNELKDDSAESRRFREFLEEDRSIEEIKIWLQECISNCSGPHDPYNRAFQDLVISIGKKLGFKIKYGRYSGVAGEINSDGIWEKDNNNLIVIEVKTSAWPIRSVSQLGEYIEKLSKEDSIENIFGLYVIGKGDLQPLTEQILGSKYKDRMRLILYDDLMEILSLKENLEHTFGNNLAIEKVQSLLLPIESINIGNIVKLIREIAATTPKNNPNVPPSGELLTKDELNSILRDVKPCQRLLLAALVQLDREPSTGKPIAFLMNKIAKYEGKNLRIDTRKIAGALSGLTRKVGSISPNKEGLIKVNWSDEEKDRLYRINENYKEIISEWTKNKICA